MFGLRVVAIMVAIMLNLCGPMGGLDQSHQAQDTVVHQISVSPMAIGRMSSFKDEGAGLVLENAYLYLRFDKSTLGGLDSVYDPVNNIEFRPDTDMSPVLFRLVVWNGSYESTLSSSSANGFIYQGSNTTTGSRLEMDLTDIGGKGIDVHCSIKVDDDDTRSYWSISINNNNQSLAITQVQYPMVMGIPSDIGGNGQDDLLTVPKLQGTSYTDPYSRVRSPQSNGLVFRYPGPMSMQFMALYDPAVSGLYLETQDPNGQVKDFLMESNGTPNDVLAGISHHGPRVLGRAPNVPYPSVISFFNGPWYRAADLYKEWALEQNWTSKGPLDQRIDMPDWWLSPSPIIMIENRDIDGTEVVPLEEWSDIITRYNILTGSNVTLYVRGWESNGTFTGPYYLPPKDGHAPLKDEIKEVIVAGGHTFLSTSGNLWTLTIPRTGYNATSIFNSTGRPYAVSDEFGRFVIDPVSASMGTPGAVMDTTTRWWQDMVVNNSKGVADLAVDVHMIGGLPVGSMVPCYDTSHGHDPGLGQYLTDGVISTIDRAFSISRDSNPDMVLASDHESELLLGKVQTYMSSDNSPELSARNLEDIHEYGEDVRTEPIFTYVYHEYTTTFGHQVNIDATTLGSMYNSSARALALDLVRGKLPTVQVGRFGIDDPGLRELLERTTWAMTGPGLDTIFKGRMLEPPVLTSPRLDIPYQDPIHNDTDWTSLKEDQLLNSAWMSMDGSRVIHAIVNWANDTVDTTMELPNYELTPDNYTVLIHRNGDTVTLEPSTHLPITIPISLMPRDVVLVEVLSAPDIVVEDMVAEPDELFIGQDSTVHVHIANRGSIDMPMVKVFLYEDGTYHGDVTIPLLEADTNETVTFEWSSRGKMQGDYNLTARVWPMPHEISDDNNEMSMVIRVSPVPVGQVRCTIIDNKTLNPLTGAEVMLFNPSNGTLVDYKSNGPGSEAVFEDVAPGTYAINASRSGYLSKENLSVMVTADTTTYVTMALEPEPLINVRGAVTGIIMDKDTTTPIAGALIQILELNLTYYTDMNGSYLFQGIDEGTYTLAVSSPHYLSANLPFSISPGTTVQVNVSLKWVPPPPRRGDLLGAVLENGTGIPIMGAKVILVEMAITTMTNDSGGFGFHSILLGNYTLNVTALGFKGIDYRVHIEFNGTNLAIIFLDGSKGPTPPQYILRGYITDPSNHVVIALVRAFIGNCTVNDTKQGCPFEEIVDQKGLYVVVMNVPGPVHVNVSAKGYVSQEFDIVVDEPGSYWSNVTLRPLKDKGDKEVDRMITIILGVINLLLIMIIVFMFLMGKRGSLEHKIRKKRVRKRIVDPMGIEEDVHIDGDE